MQNYNTGTPPETLEEYIAIGYKYESVETPDGPVRTLVRDEEGNPVELRYAVPTRFKASQLIEFAKYAKSSGLYDAMQDLNDAKPGENPTDDEVIAFATLVQNAFGLMIEGAANLYGDELILKIVAPNNGVNDEDLYSIVGGLLGRIGMFDGLEEDPGDTPLDLVSPTPSAS